LKHAVSEGAHTGGAQKKNAEVINDDRHPYPIRQDPLGGRTVRHDSKEYFAEWLSRTLAERNIAGGDVAKALEVNDSAVSRWRNGRASPGLDSIMKLAAYLEVNPIALAVTAGLMDEQEVGMAPLPLPDDTAARKAERQEVLKRLSRRRDREAVAKVLDVLEVQDDLSTAPPEERLGDAIDKAEEAIDALRELLTHTSNAPTEG
jgi:transcriptional regulator with XRE-family HTH domain